MKIRNYQFSHLILRLIIASDYEAILWKAFVGRHLELTFKPGWVDVCGLVKRKVCNVLRGKCKEPQKWIEETET
jgi:hypothetical protein